MKIINTNIKVGQPSSIFRENRSDRVHNIPNNNKMYEIIRLRLSCCSTDNSLQFSSNFVRPDADDEGKRWKNDGDDGGLRENIIKSCSFSTASATSAAAAIQLDFLCAALNNMYYYIDPKHTIISSITSLRCRWI